MKTNFIKKGFTLIELLVVIVIIGILSTVGVATFQGYFEKARDAEKKTVVRNISVILRTGLALQGTVDFGKNPTDTTQDITKDNIVKKLESEGGYTLPGKPGHGSYFYVYDGDAPEEFAVFVCSEAIAEEVFVDGTAKLVQRVKSKKKGICTTNPKNANQAQTKLELAVTASGSGITPVVEAMVAAPKVVVIDLTPDTSNPSTPPTTPPTTPPATP